MRRWREAMAALVPVNRWRSTSYDRLAAGGVTTPTHEAKSFLAAYRSSAERAALLDEIEHIRGAGQDVDYELLDGDELREVEPVAVRRGGFRDPAVSPAVHPPGGVRRARWPTAVRARGGSIREGSRVEDAHRHRARRGPGR